MVTISGTCNQVRKKYFGVRLKRRPVEPHHSKFFPDRFNDLEGRTRGQTDGYNERVIPFLFVSISFRLILQ